MKPCVVLLRLLTRNLRGVTATRHYDMACLVTDKMGAQKNRCMGGGISVPRKYFSAAKKANSFQTCKKWREILRKIYANIVRRLKPAYNLEVKGCLNMGLSWRGKHTYNHVRVSAVLHVPFIRCAKKSQFFLPNLHFK